MQWTLGRIRLNDPCPVAMRLYANLLYPLDVIIQADFWRQFCITLTNIMTFYWITFHIIISERVHAILDRSGMIFCHMTNTVHGANKAVIDRRFRPRCCRLGSYFKRPKSSPVCPLACNWYYCAQFIAKPKAACALRFSWSATSSNLGL